MSSVKLGDDFLRIPKLDVSGSNWVIYKDRFMWSIDARGLLGHLTGVEIQPVDPIEDRDKERESPLVLTEAQKALDEEYKTKLKTIHEDPWTPEGPRDLGSVVERLPEEVAHGLC